MATIDRVILEPLNFQQVNLQNVEDVNYFVNPFDSFGNLLPKMTIEFLSEYDVVAFLPLPLISNFNNNLNFQLIVIWNGNLGSLSVTFDNNDTGVQVSLETKGVSYIFQPVSETNWNVPNQAY